MSTSLSLFPCLPSFFLFVISSSIVPLPFLFSAFHIFPYLNFSCPLLLPARKRSLFSSIRFLIIIIHPWPQYLFFYHSTDMSSGHEEPGTNKNNGENSKDPFHCWRLEGSANGQPRSAEGDLRENKRPPLHRESCLSRSRDAHAGESEEPEAEKPEEDTGGNTDGFPHVSNWDARYT